MSLEELRERLSGLDRQLLEVVAERQRITAEIGALKQTTGKQTRDFEREKEVFDLARREAGRLGLSAELAETLIGHLIRASLTSQEETRVAAEGRGSGERALIIGGRGKMGEWFARFLASQRYEVETADPAGPLGDLGHVNDWRDSAVDHEIILLATPISTTADILPALAARRPAGLILDIGSLKTPLRAGLADAAAAGCRIASLHPMFGPDTRLLSGRHVIFVDTGVPDATRDARALFASTMAEQVEMSLEEHDRLIAYILGLSHALNIAFFTALAQSHEAVPRLRELSSTTFDAQLAVASRVAEDNPRLYYEIQSLNEHGAAALESLERAVERLRTLIADDDRSGFVELMERGRAYLATTRG